MGRYVEPFAGSAAVFFATQPSAALLADLNTELARTFCAVRDDHEEVANELGRLDLGPAAYYRVRALDPTSLASSARAARFIYLNRFCFNGLYRTNREGRFNVPYGAPKTLNLPSPESLARCARSLASAEILAADFRTILAQAQQGDFYYLDPPYAVSRRRVFVEYGARAFSASDLDDLKAGLVALDAVGATFVLSYADCREGRELANGRPARRLRVRRHVAGFSGSRRVQYELVISNHADFPDIIPPRAGAR